MSQITHIYLFLSKENIELWASDHKTRQNI